VLLSFSLDGCATAALTASTLPGLSVTLALLPMLVKLAELMTSMEAVVAVLELPHEPPPSTLLQTWSSVPLSVSVPLLTATLSWLSTMVEMITPLALAVLTSALRLRLAEYVADGDGADVHGAGAGDLHVAQREGATRTCRSRSLTSIGARRG
jgi:hypothetical protein